MSMRTNQHRRGCACPDCRAAGNPSYLVRPGTRDYSVECGDAISLADATDDQIIRIVTARPTDIDVMYDDGYRCGPVKDGITFEVSAPWGADPDRTVTLTAPDAHRLRRNPGSIVRTVAVGDVRTVFDAQYVTPAKRNGGIVAGRYRLETRSLLDSADRISLAEIIAVADGLRDVVIDVEARTESDYGYGGELYDHGVASCQLYGWRLVD